MCGKCYSFLFIDCQTESFVAQVAFNEDGSPSKALAGFCKKNGVAEADVSVEADGKGVEYVWASKQDGGRSAAEVRHLDN